MCMDMLYSRVGGYITYYQLIPFKTILRVGSFNFFRQVVCNILLFVPIPIIIKIIANKMSGVKVILAGYVILYKRIVRTFRNSYIQKMIEKTKSEESRRL